MIRNLKDVINNLKLDVKKITLYNNSVIYEDSNYKKYVIKENTNNIVSIYNYLSSRNFNYLPKIKYCDNNIYIYDYITGVNTPLNQKASDLIKLDALLHNKTVYYKEVSLDEIKEIYDKLKKDITVSEEFYKDIIEKIEANVFMSPSFYMLARNYSSIMSCINFCKYNLDEWYKIVKENKKQRIVLLHNNLDVNHIIKSNDNYLIALNKMVWNFPIYDFINFYKKNYDKYDFNELYKEYLKKFPLFKEEKILLFVILFIPNIINYTSDELLNTINVSKLCNYLYTTDKLFMENEAKNTKEEYHKIDEQKKNMESST